MIKKAMLLPALIIVLLSGATKTTLAQEGAKKFGIRFSGFIKGDVIFDTRQNAESREGFFILYPLAPDYDANGDDINASPGFNQYAMTSRLTGKISGPDVLGAQTSGLIEGGFTGPSNTTNNTFRLRHAWFKLQWKKTSFLAGQYWSPLDAISVAPKVLALNTGTPFRSFSRNPQLRFCWDFIKNATIIAAAYNQRDFASIGPEGRSFIYLRNAALPNLHLQIQWKPGAHLLGAGIDYKEIKPRLKTTSGYKTDEKVAGLSFIGFIDLKFDKFELKMQSIFGQNLNDHLMMGGFYAGTYDEKTGIAGYTSPKMISGWIDIQSREEHFNAGVFAGYAQNLDMPYVAENQIIYFQGQDIHHCYRISPRLTYATGPVQFLAEAEITTAEFRYKPADEDQQDKIDRATNLRIHLAVLYAF